MTSNYAFLQLAQKNVTNNPNSLLKFRISVFCSNYKYQSQFKGFEKDILYTALTLKSIAISMFQCSLGGTVTHIL